MSVIEVTEPEEEAVYSWLREFNWEQNGAFMSSLEQDGTEIPIFLGSRGPDGEIVGGLKGVLLHQWLKIDLMVIDPKSRRQGLGRDLVQRAEQLARGHACHYSYVDTMSYQAPGFYLDLGYAEVGRLPNWDSHGHDKLLFMKKLVAE